MRASLLLRSSRSISRLRAGRGVRGVATSSIAGRGVRGVATSSIAGLDELIGGLSLPAAARTLLTTHADRLLAPTGMPNCMPPEKHVFCNRELRLDRVDVIGFDYDYTLASYTTALQEFIYEKARDYLLERLRYPPELSSRRYDPEFPIRGLVFDRKHGVLCKLSYSNALSPDTAYLGRRRLDEAELRRLYGESLHVPIGHVENHMLVLNDLFSLAEACLLADVVQLAVESNVPFDAGALAADVSKAIGYVHISGTMHDTVASRPEDFLHPSPSLGGLLADSRAAGKKLFLLTNSAFPFVDAGMRFLVGAEWRQLFDVVVTSAQKPGFYSGDRPFRVYSSKSTPASQDFIGWRHAGLHDLKDGRVLIGGSLAELERLTGWAGQQVLYVGDHLYADLREPRREAGWATAAIVRELERELEVTRTPAYRALHARNVLVDRLLQRVQLLQLPADEVTAVLDALELERARIRSTVPTLFNAHFGAVFRHRSDSTAYAFALKKHVDLYAARLEDLLALDSSYRFYPTRCKILPHDPR